MDPLRLQASVMASYLDIVKGVSEQKSKQDPVSTQYRDRVQQITSTSPSLSLAANPSVGTILRSLQKHRLLDNVPKRPKCAQTAMRHRRQGNQLYKARKFDDAVDEYNASISFAESGSQDLGIAYANRSSVCFEEGEYETALINIGLAKAHNYPASLLPKLLTREKKCKENLREGLPKKTIGRRMPINVEVNPKIPSVAKGIYMQEDAKTGYGLWTARDFKTGDVILHERTMLANMDNYTKYSACSYCYAKEGIVSRLLIPCSKCTMVVYCSDDCMRNGWHYFHRFECDISEKIEYVAGGGLMFGVRMFFYELAMFEDDLDKMMNHHEDSSRPRRDPFSVEYAEDGRLKNATDFYDVIFRKRPQEAKPEENYMVNVFTAAASLCFLQYPFVQQYNADANNRVKKMMLETVTHYTQICFQLSRTSHHYAISSICKRSCDPNVSEAPLNGHVKLIALRPIRKGEEIYVSNCFEWWTPPEMRRLRPSEHGCQCCVCDPTQHDKWRASGKALSDAARKEWKVISRLVVESNFDDAAKFNAMQQFIERYAHVHPNKQFALAVAAFQRLAETLIIEEFNADLRSGLSAKILD